MTVIYEIPPSRRAVSAPHSSLINRIQKPPLADRLSSDDSQIRDSSGPYVSLSHLHFKKKIIYSLCYSGPTRSRPSRRGGRGSNRGGAQRSEPKSNVPKTAEELDKELDMFMGDSAGAVDGEKAGDAAVEQDVEMA